MGIAGATLKTPKPVKIEYQSDTLIFTRLDKGRHSGSYHCEMLPALVIEKRYDRSTDDFTWTASLYAEEQCQGDDAETAQEAFDNCIKAVNEEIADLQSCLKVKK